MSTLENRVCVVTGGASGIGRAIAVKFAARGAKAVIVADIDKSGAEETVVQIQSMGVAASVKITDVEVPEQITELMAYAADRHDGLDVLVNNVGRAEDVYAEDTSVDKLPPEVFDKVFRLNLRSIFLATQAAAPYLRASKNDPCILNAASVGGLAGFGGYPAYGSTKAAIMQFTRAAAVDLAPDVRVNAYAPGVIDTPPVRRLLDKPDGHKSALISTHLIPRIGTPDDVANVVAFLASSEASFITGATYIVDGGSFAWRGNA